MDADKSRPVRRPPAAASKRDPVRRPRKPARPELDAGPQQKVRDLLYDLHDKAGRPAMEDLEGRIAGDDRLDAVPKKDRIHKIITRGGPASLDEVQAVVRTLARACGEDEIRAAAAVAQLMDSSGQAPGSGAANELPGYVPRALGEPLKLFLDRRRSLTPKMRAAVWIAVYGLVVFSLTFLAPVIFPSDLSAELNRFEQMPVLVAQLQPLALLPWWVAGGLAFSWCFGLSRRTAWGPVAAAAIWIIIKTPMTFTVFHALISCCAVIGLAWRRGVRWPLVVLGPAPLLLLVGGVQLVDSQWREQTPAVNTWIGRALAGRMLDGLERDNITAPDGQRISVLYLGTDENGSMHTLRHFPPTLLLISAGTRERCHFGYGAQQRPLDLLPFVPGTTPPCVASHWVK